MIKNWKRYGKTGSARLGFIKAAKDLSNAETSEEFAVSQSA
jgi:hypothetical protein